MWRSPRTGAIAVIFCLAALATTGCSDGASSSEEQQTDGHDHSHDFGQTGDNFEFTLGEPADAGDATRTIEVDAVERFRFVPSSLEVAAGETVTFRVTNRDQIEHELILGNKDYQRLHESQVQAGGVYHNYSDYSVHVMPGETRSFTWTFQRPGRIQFACHVEGHYDEGMIGRIRIS